MGISKKEVLKRKRSIDLLRPENWLLKISTRLKSSLGCLCIFIVLGVFLQQRYPFPCFYPFIGLFLFIGVSCFFSEKYYCEKIQQITSALRHQRCVASANYFMSMRGMRSAVFVAAPAATVLIFGTGGCLMFGAIRLTPTLIWVLFLFSVVVSISIVGYLQYINLAVYIAKLSHCPEDYKSLEKGPVNCIPAELSWIKELTKLSHIYQVVFFTIGCAYITAFSGFCFWPEMEAETDTAIFYILWSIIFTAIVLTFPAVSVLEHKWIKRIVHNLKRSYIHDLERENMLLKRSHSEQLTSIIVSISARQILDSKEYPLRSLWSNGYAVVMTFINFVATATTIFTDTLPFISDLRQFFL